eukprot:12898959-Prorocentrum_lima.AAC.1
MGWGIHGVESGENAWLDGWLAGRQRPAPHADPLRPPCLPVRLPASLCFPNIQPPTPPRKEEQQT